MTNKTPAMIEAEHDDLIKWKNTFEKKQADEIEWRKNLETTIGQLTAGNYDLAKLVDVLNSRLKHTEGDVKRLQIQVRSIGDKQ